MTKKEIIKQSIMGTCNLASGIISKDSNKGVYYDSLYFQNTVIVDIDKLAEFLAKYINIKPEDLIES